MTLSTVKNWFHFSHEPFHVVLVDLKKAANGEIECVKKPLEDSLKYVAISYRWGELEEIVVDTKLGYIAIIKSFHLDDFYQLCRMITKEIDLQYMDYVWVDAICVDQTNYEQRKFTIYQMSNIYQHAKYILAVPDLHAAYLKTTSPMTKSAMEGSAKYQTDIYHLLHDILDANDAFDELFDAILNVRGDDDFRKVIELYANAFTDDFSRQQVLEKKLYKFFKNLLNNNQTEDPTLAENRMEEDDVLIKRRHLEHGSNTNIQERRTAIQQSIEFLEYLIKDWSTRVWVISEFNIAKENDNLKYWFTQLVPDIKNDHLDCGGKEFSFFKFKPLGDAEDLLSVVNGQYTNLISKFVTTMENQLQKQSLFEMLLKSKASKHEDRFYAILPLTKYKDNIKNKAMVNSWKIDSIISVKLKLFELMNTNDKLNLLFFAGNPLSTLSGILPSFATSTLHWGASETYFNVYGVHSVYINDPFYKETGPNIDLYCVDNAIVLRQSKTLGVFYLHFCPMECYVDEKFVPSKDDVSIIFEQNRALEALYSKDPFDINALVCIPSVRYVRHIKDMENQPTFKEILPITDRFGVIYLIGNFEKNKWVLTACHTVSKDHQWKLHSVDDYRGVFNIY